MSDGATVLIGGDVYPGGRLSGVFASGNAEALFGCFLHSLKQADISVVNLECPLISAPEPIRKVGPNLSAPPEAIQGLSTAGIDLLCLANNHIRDHGTRGVMETLSTCEHAGIDTVGAGSTAEDAGRLVIRNVKGVRIAFYACAERESSIVSPDRAGANPLDLIHFVSTIRANQNRFDHLIVLYHGGVELFPYPTPEMRRRCRFMIDMGASAVICTHTHCPSAYEEYEGGLIVYGQGNFIFDYGHVTDDGWFQGFLVTLELKDNGHLSHQFLHYRQQTDTPIIYRPDDSTMMSMIARLEERSRIAKDSEALREHWRKFCNEERKVYTDMLCADRPLVLWACQWAGVRNLLHPKPQRDLAHNLVRCESHREILTTLID